jgi:hypothetical protein
MPKKPQQSRQKAREVAKKRPAKSAAGSPVIDTTTVPPIAKLISQILDANRANAAASPPKPLPAGTVGPEIPVNLQSLQQLIIAAATEDSQRAVQVWTKDSSELLVVTGKVAITLDDGLVLISIPVSCDQLSSGVIVVPFAAGGKETPSGMVFATEDRPRGPELIVDVWGEALTAYAWKLLLTVTHRLTLQSGVDEDGAGLVPIAFTAAKDGVTLLPIARHTFDRVRL